MNQDDADSFWDKQKPSYLEGMKNWVGSKALAIGKVMGSSLGAGLASCSGGGLETDSLVAGFAAAGEEAGVNVEAYFQARAERKRGLEGVRDALKKIGNDLIKNQKKPLVFVVDELDRCRPDFALDLLESIKHVMSVPGIVFLLVYNGKQMCGHIRCRYGDNVEADIYLNKFINLSTLLPKSKELRRCHSDDNFRFISYLSDEMDMPLRDMEMISAYAGELNLSFREIERVLTYMAIMKSSLGEKMGEWIPIIFGLSVIKCMQESLFRKIYSGEECWDEIESLFRFGQFTGADAEYIGTDFFEQSWRGFLDPNADPKLKRQFALPYRTGNQVLMYCRSLLYFNPVSQ